MSALNVEFTDEEMAELRWYAQQYGLPLKAAVRHAVMAAAHTHRVHEATTRAMRIGEGLNRRLADL